MLPAAKRGVHSPGLTDAWNGDSAPQPVGNHPHRTQPAASHPTSGSLSISIHRAKYLQPLCASSCTDPNPRHQDTSHGTVASHYQHQVNSRLPTPDRCEFFHLNQDQLITSCPILRAKKYRPNSLKVTSPFSFGAHTPRL